MSVENNQLPLLSVVIPCFNAVEYISLCVSSLFAQNYQNWEAIFINDGSKDSTLSSLISYAIQDRRIKVYSQLNQGAAKAREYGLSKATGDFITFLDVDDTLQENALEQMLRAFDEDTDIVVSGFNIVKGKSVRRKILHPCKLSSIDYLKKVLCGKYGWELWAKMYRKELFTISIKIPQGIRIGEDAAVFIQLVCTSRQVKVLSESSYNYIQYTQSASHIRSRKYAEETLQAAFFIENILKDTSYYQEIKPEIDAMFLLFYSNSIRKGNLSRHHPLVRQLRESHWNRSAFLRVPWYKAVYVFLSFHLRAFALI